MKLRLYAAIVTGILIDILTMAAMWEYTDFNICRVAVWGTVAYLAGIFTVLWRTEPKKKPRRRTEAKFFTIGKENEDVRSRNQRAV